MKKSILFLMMLIAAATVSAQDLVDKVSQAVGVELPSEYKGKVKNFVMNSKILSYKDAQTFTELFIKEQMNTNWGINKQNQLLFIWDAIYEQITKKNFYDGEDGNKQRLDNFEKALDNIEACGKKYKQDFTAYMEKQSAEAKKQSAEAKKQSAEAKKQSAEVTKAGLSQITRYYNLCKEYPTAIDNEELEETKKYAKHVIQNCKEFNLDYKAILRKELGNEQKVKDILKFYGIE